MKTTQEGKLVGTHGDQPRGPLPVIKIMTAICGLGHVGDVLDPYRWYPDVKN